MAKVIVELPYMGAYCGSHCAIILNEEKKKIYCVCTRGFPECDMSQVNGGMTSYCPLYGFNFDLKKEKEKFLRYLNYLKEYKILEEHKIEKLEKLEKIFAGAHPAE